MKQTNYKRTKFACYFTYIATSAVFSLPPVLFAVFRDMYNISYTLLGTLVLVNFCTQLGIDLIFSFFSKYFNIHKTFRAMPIITALGLCVYAIIPTIFPQYAYIGLVIGTFIFSVSAGLAEVLVSPTIAALPSETPEKDMSILHSLYGYGFVSIVIISTLFIQFVGQKYWMYLTLFFSILPMIAAIILRCSPLPNMDMDQNDIKASKNKQRTKGLLLCVLCIFLGGCAENTMTNWVSVYAENALHLPKVWGDILGLALFSILLALTRSVYAKYGKNIFKTLKLSMFSAVVCYLLVALSPNAFFSLIACVTLGICTSMLWPGTLILMEEKIPAVGVAAYALMAAGGDFGASIAPQVLGIIVDNIALTKWAAALGNIMSLSAEQIGFKFGMLLAAVFPLLGGILLIYMGKFFDKNNK